MKLDKYEIFLKVAEIGNISKAADVLHYSQAGISHAIAALEKEAEVSLFVRSASGVTLTENGKALLEPVRALVNEQNHLMQKIYELNHMVAGTLRLGTFHSVSVHWLPRLISEFQSRYPKVEFELIAGDYDTIGDSIRMGKLDCGFLSAPVPEDLEYIPLYHDPMMAIVAKDHPLAKRKRVTLEELVREPFIMPLKGCDNDIFNALGKWSGEIQVKYALNDEYSVMALVAEGFGVTLMPELMYRDFKIDVATVPLTPTQHRVMGISALPLKQQTTLTRAFLQFLAEEETKGHLSAWAKS